MGKLYRNYDFGIQLFYLTVFLLTFLCVLGLIEHVAEDVNQVKVITKNTNKEMKEGFNETQGKHI